MNINRDCEAPRHPHDKAQARLSQRRKRDRPVRLPHNGREPLAFIMVPAGGVLSPWVKRVLPAN
ncbi:hypothetical protein GCM10019059_37720 [Camelimonas fluminis]|nr:hypothetical protein GCM10019059_37720 [Camelimonas fluminis]